MTDTAKELLALSAQIVAPHAPFSFLTRDERKMTIDALRLSARKQASVEELSGYIHTLRSMTSWQMATVLLAKYDIFEKVEG
jgi:hypothetical protein